MKKMKKKALPLIAAALLMVLLTACGSSIGENAATYFRVTQKTVSQLLNSGGSDQALAQSESAERVQLDTPQNFSMDADGNYSFDAVTGADYYLIAFCDPSAVQDEDTYLYISGQIKEDGSHTYAGYYDDILDCAFGEYLVKVFAYPKVGDDQHLRSSAATAGFTSTGILSAPELYYCWNTFDKTFGIEVGNISKYLGQSAPIDLHITLTCADDPAATKSFTISDISDVNYTMETTEVTPDVDYTITASVYSDNPYLLSSESDEAVIGSFATGAHNAISGMYQYTIGAPGGSVMGRAAWPLVSDAGFTLSAAGDLGQYKDTSMMIYGVPVVYTFYGEPAATAAGAVHSYELWYYSEGNWNSPNLTQGTLDLYADGTFTAFMPSMFGNNSVQGAWTEKDDGTVIFDWNVATSARVP